MSDSVVGLIGVALGFALGAGWEQIREWRKRKLLKQQMLEELKLNLLMLPKKREIIENIINTLTAGQLISGESVAFCSEIYSNHYPSVCYHYNLKERNSLHTIYEYFRVIDSTLANYDTELLSGAGSRQPVFGRAIAEMRDILTLTSIAEELIGKHLSGRPGDSLGLDRFNANPQETR